jgi:hypothetical protein
MAFFTVLAGAIFVRLVPISGSASEESGTKNQDSG